jgi:spore germination protein YaaH
MREVMPFWFTFKYNANKVSITDLYTPANPNIPMSTPLATIRNAGLTIIPTITDGTDKLVLANLLSTEQGRNDSVKAITDLVLANNFDGIDLDFENFAFVDGNTTWDKTKPSWIAFVKALSTSLHLNGKLLSITSPYLLDPATR